MVEPLINFVLIQPLANYASITGFFVVMFFSLMPAYLLEAVHCFALTSQKNIYGLKCQSLQ